MLTLRRLLRRLKRHTLRQQGVTAAGDEREADKNRHEGQVRAMEGGQQMSVTSAATARDRGDRHAATSSSISSRTLHKVDAKSSLPSGNIGN